MTIKEGFNDIINTPIDVAQISSAINTFAMWVCSAFAVSLILSVVFILYKKKR
jgi:hypothetical protein